MSEELDFDDYEVKNVRYSVTSVTGPHVAGLEDYIILSSGSSVVLPVAATNKGRMYIIKSTGDSDISLAVLLPLPNPALLTVSSGSCMHIVSDGVTWVDVSPSSAIEN